MVEPRNHQPSRPSFGDRVVIRSTPLTQERGLAGLLGQVYGETTPSITNVDVIGEPSIDFALNVHVEDKNEAYWFAEELLEFVDHGGGTEIRINGVPKKWTRTKDGAWLEQDAKDVSSPNKPWWRFW